MSRRTGNNYSGPRWAFSQRSPTRETDTWRIGSRVTDRERPTDRGEVIRNFIRDKVEWATVKLDSGEHVTRVGDRWQHID